MITLKDTVSSMLSDDYRERFKAEYYQLKIRLESLQHMVEAWDRDELDFTPTCPRAVYNRQLDYMAAYKLMLEDRAELEAIAL